MGLFLLARKKSGGFLPPIVRLRIDPNLGASGPESPSVFRTNGFQFRQYDIQLVIEPLLPSGIPLGRISAIGLTIKHPVMLVIGINRGGIVCHEGIIPLHPQGNIILAGSEGREVEIAAYDGTPTNLRKDRLENSQGNVSLPNSNSGRCFLLPFYRHQKPPVGLGLWKNVWRCPPSPTFSLQDITPPFRCKEKMKKKRIYFSVIRGKLAWHMLKNQLV